MLAVVKEHAGPGFAVKEVPAPVCREDDVIIRVRSVGICGSDMPILAGTRTIPWPMTPGHEFAGDIVEVGAKVTRFHVGDRVSNCLVIGCGDCKYCVEGKENLCDDLIETGIHVDGAFAEYVRVPAKTCARLRDETSYDIGASIDPIASAYRTVKAMDPAPKDTVVVLGPGPIGLYAVQLLHLYGVAKIIIVGTTGDEGRLALAKELGAHYTINGGTEDIVARVRELTGGAMADFVQDCAGAPPLVPVAMDCLKKGGTYALTGLFHEPVPMELGKVVRSEISVMGTICYTREEFKECLTLAEDGRVQILPLITHHFPLAEMQQAYEVARARQSIKIIMHP